jgi:hypothetical protein
VAKQVTLDDVTHVPPLNGRGRMGGSSIEEERTERMKENTK